MTGALSSVDLVVFGYFAALLVVGLWADHSLARQRKGNR